MHHHPSFGILTLEDVLILARHSLGAYEDAYTFSENNIVLEYFHEESNDAQAIGLVDDTFSFGTAVVVAFRGTESLKDVGTDLMISRTPLYREESSLINWCSQPLVHSGFKRQHDSLLGEISRFCQSHSNIPFVVFTGHSLGGGLATIASVTLGQILKREHGKVVACATYGSPRTGNSSFTKLFRDQVGESSVRVVNDDDPIPLVPSSLRFKHVHGGLYLDEEQEGFRVGAPMWSRWFQVVGNGILSLFGVGGRPSKDHYCQNYVSELEALLMKLK